MVQADEFKYLGSMKGNVSRMVYGLESGTDKRCRDGGFRVSQRADRLRGTVLEKEAEGVWTCAEYVMKMELPGRRARKTTETLRG